YLSDSICVLYGYPTAYGVVTLPYGVREGINVFLDGFIPTEKRGRVQTSIHAAAGAFFGPNGETPA
ncbi:MAG: hypothetical protein MJA83_09840, partial [Gammaproteobacteria bacterium]|nr:hypothetical protein [Gammaproteobacteria bacterium]